ncbi:hypothetical protein [Roseibacillus ishigakijimensis]|uniref:Uncharacterized protein n=1 Tax=Roseibacillus ishigakijimensis TaxID=454146 RepID=A0A934VLW6_9BACT|nr:hypothetical protein [Roseibacillus ishigakijimensis]MBK1835114.1 hypothetical protein [Roseibacillus ishigakijimensis]
MVAEPEKEIRFTRTGQARSFALLGAIALAVAFTFVAPHLYGHRSPVHGLWTLPLLAVGGGFFWLSRHCAKHAFLILSPVGIEFFPFIRPTKNYRLWSWAEFHRAEIKDKTLTLHFDEKKTAGAVISLGPLTAESRLLLTRAIEGRMAERFGEEGKESGAETTSADDTTAPE